MRWHRQELALSEDLGDELGSGIACRRVGECLCEVGDYEEATDYQKMHLEISRKIGKYLSTCSYV